MLKSKKHAINIGVLPGQPTDGSGRVSIHLFVQDDAGPMVEPHALSLAKDEGGNDTTNSSLVAAPTRGRLACNKIPATNNNNNNIVTITLRTDDPRATTCPRCIASDAYKMAMAKLEKG